MGRRSGERACAPAGVRRPAYVVLLSHVTWSGPLAESVGFPPLILIMLLFEYKGPLALIFKPQQYSGATAGPAVNGLV
mgnify:CR=1 FL=1